MAYDGIGVGVGGMGRDIPGAIGSSDLATQRASRDRTRF